MISVIVPVYNDPEGIRETLHSVLNQSSESKEYEVLVVDNGSTDATPEVIREFAADHQQVALRFEREIQGSYAARNRGIEASEGNILAFVDADMTMGEDWVAAVDRSMQTHEAPYVGCDVEVVIEGDETPVAQYSEANAFPVAEYMENDNFAPTCCLVTRRELFDEVGLFDERLVSGGDVEFGQRVHRAGYEQRFEPNVVLTHPARDSVRSLASKMFRVGRGLRQLARYYPDRTSSENKVWRRPSGYLPPRPVRFFRRDEYRSDPLSRVLSFYLLTYLVRVSRTAGAGYQHLAGTMPAFRG
jgi:glycosyltransferase involved in cell wall biosynthesis